MSETLIPTTQLRFINGYVAAPDLGPGFNRPAKILQQRFEKPSGGSVWVDVPFDEKVNAGV